MNGQEEAILKLWNEEKMMPESIALKLGIKLSEVLYTILPKAVGYADDARDKERATATE